MTQQNDQSSGVRDRQRTWALTWLSVAILALLAGLIFGGLMASPVQGQGAVVPPEAEPGRLPLPGDPSCENQLSDSPPPDPSDLQCIPISATEIELCWRDNSCIESAFHVERSLNGSVWGEIGSTPRNQNWFLDTGVITGTTYFYRVRAYRQSTDEFSGYTNVASCTASQMTLISPADRAQMGQVPVFGWQPLSGAITYTLQVDNDLLFGSPEINVEVTATTRYSPTVSLADGTYYWRVKARNECAASGWSPTWSVILTAEGLPPGTPELVSPPDGQETCELPITFSWRPPAGAESCCLQLDDNPDFSSPIVTECEITSPYTLAVSLNPGTYYWRVRCRNECGYGDWSPVRSLSILRPPDPPTLQQPSDGFQTCSTTPTFSWSPVQGVSCYSFQLDNDPDFSTPLINESCRPTTAYTVTTPLTPGVYYWRAGAYGECGRSWSQPRSLFVGPPQAPALTSPPDAGGICAPQPTFSWTPSPGASSCCFQLDDNRDFSPPIVNECQVSSPYIVTMSLSPGTYYWRVRCDNACGQGSWSTLRTVNIQDYESACQYLVSNGDFESREAWLTSGACAPRYSTDRARSGSRSMLLGISPSAPDTQCTSAIWQPVTIPAEATSAILSFWYWPWSQDTITNDWQEVQVRDAGFNVLETLMQVNESNGPSDPWRKHAFDVTRYAGQTIYIYFAVYNDGGPGGRTYMYVDDVALIACQTRLCRPVGTPIAGRVTLQGRSAYEGVQVSVDGTACGVTDGQGRFQCTVTPGTRLVSASRCKYLTAQGTFTVPVGTTAFNLPDVILPGGDVNSNCRVDIFDLTITGNAYDTCPGDTCATADINGDGCVNILDLVILGGNYGLECPRPWSSTLAMGMAATASTAPTKVHLSRAREDARGTQFQIWLEGASQLYAADIRFHFDPETVRVVDADRNAKGVQIQLGPELRDAGTFVVRAQADNTTGVIHLAFTRLAPAPPLRGDVLLATINLTAVGELRIEELELLDPKGRALKWAAPDSEGQSP